MIGIAAISKLIPKNKIPLGVSVASNAMNKATNPALRPFRDDKQAASSASASGVRGYAPVLAANGRDGMRGMFDPQVQSYIKTRLSGQPAPDLAAKFREMDESTARAASNARTSAGQGLGMAGMFGQGGARRAMQGQENLAMKQVADNKLEQAKLLGADTRQAMTDAVAYDRGTTQDRLAAARQAFEMAQATGSGTMMGGLLDQYVGDIGYDVTGHGRASMGEEAQYARDNQERMRQIQESYLRRKAPKSNLFQYGGDIVSGLSSMLS